MNIIIPSNVRSIAGDNQTNKFKMRLPVSIDALNKEKSIRVTNVMYPKSIMNIKEDSCFFKLVIHYNHISNYSPVGHVYFKTRYYYTYDYNGSNNGFRFETDKIVINNGIYNLEKLLTVINNSLLEYNVRFEKSIDGRIRVKWNAFNQMWLFQKDHPDNTGRQATADWGYVFKNKSPFHRLSNNYSNSHYDISRYRSHPYTKVRYDYSKAFDEGSKETFRKFNHASSLTNNTTKDLNLDYHGTSIKSQNPFEDPDEYPVNAVEEKFYTYVDLHIEMSDALTHLLGLSKKTLRFQAKIVYDDYNTFQNIETVYSDFLPNIQSNINCMYIYMDELESSVVGDTSSELLCLVAIENGGQDDDAGLMVSYQPPVTSKKLKKNHITEFNITIYDSLGELILFDFGNINIEAVIE